MNKFHDSYPSITPEADKRKKELKLKLGAAAGVITFLSVLTYNTVSDSASEACSPKTSINPDKMHSSINGDYADASIYQVNNAINAGQEQGDVSFRYISQEEREELARDITADVKRIDNPDTSAIETGTVCVTIDESETTVSTK